MYACFHVSRIFGPRMCACLFLCVCVHVCCSHRAAEHMIIDDDSSRPFLTLYAGDEDKRRKKEREKKRGVSDVFRKLCSGVGSDSALVHVCLCVCVCVCVYTQEMLLPPTDP